MSPLAWITGAGGLIGSHLVRAAAQLAPRWQVRPLTREQLDLCDAPAVQSAFALDQPQLIIHCAALTRSQACQADRARAWRINVHATEHLAELSAGVRLVFFSTDLVFDGHLGGYSESAAVNPLSVYGESKVAAEKAVLANPRHMVIRTSLNGGRSPTGDRGFDEQLRLAWSRGEKTRLFCDEFRSPIAAQVTARAVWELIEQDLSGLFHIAGAERVSRWDLGQLLAARWPELQPQLEPASLRDYAGPPRAPDTSLNCEKAQRVLSFPLPRFREWLKAKPDDIAA